MDDKIVYCNRNMSDEFNCQSPDGIIGRNLKSILSDASYERTVCFKEIANKTHSATVNRATLEFTINNITKKQVIQSTTIPLYSENGDVEFIFSYDVVPRSIQLKDFIKKHMADNPCKKIKLKKYQFHYEGNIVTFNTKETICALLLMSGMSSKTIAGRMNLSYRTVDDYINSIKSKLDVTNRKDIVLVLSNNSGFSDYFISHENLV